MSKTEIAGVPELFGSLTFNLKVMEERLPIDVFNAVKLAIDEGQAISTDVANIVARRMKEWAIENGATHYTHWFQPMTGITAEKHDAFIEPTEDGGVIMKFSGKNLIQGEPDASSFPSGGLRSTFEARGYTAWDPSSFAFIKDHTLCIPTAFCSYGGEALDKKTPLLRSIQALSTQAVRILRLFGDTETKTVRACVGPEQEYFLVDKALYEQREDLKFCGRTLFGAQPPKGQELEDHYFGSIRPRVLAYMADLNDELWKLGILAKTEHNEVAPAQHELAPIFSTVNIATDHNQLTMEIMKKVAERHGLACLLHEKPFAGVNGSGKHNNWSIATDGGTNLLSPGATPYENAQFLLFLVATIEAVDTYADLLRMSVATAGNDHRLGANEAPPAVISVFLGDELAAVLDAIVNDKPYSGAQKTAMQLGVDVLPVFAKDTTDRNRTSPFAFTGNKFEFRMVGSSNSIACANIMLNAGVAQVLEGYANQLEKAEDFEGALHALIKKAIADHQRVVFNGNGYDDAWIEEAVNVRGLSNLRTTPDAMPALIAPANKEMLVHQKIFTPEEVDSRYEIVLDNYTKVVTIEAKTMARMTRRQIIPAIEKYTGKLLKVATGKAELGIDAKYEKRALAALDSLVEQIDANVVVLEAAIAANKDIADVTAQANDIRDAVIPAMEALRAPADAAENLVSRECWPIPSYSQLLFSV